MKQVAATTLASACTARVTRPRLQGVRTRCRVPGAVHKQLDLENAYVNRVPTRNGARNGSGVHTIRLRRPIR